VHEEALTVDDRDKAKSGTPRLVATRPDRPVLNQNIADRRQSVP